MSRSRSYSEARSRAPAQREPSDTSIESSSGVNSRWSSNVKTNAPMMRFMIRSGTPTAVHGDPSRRRIRHDDRCAIHGLLAHLKLSCLRGLVGSADRLLGLEVALVIDEEQHAAVGMNPG